MQKHDNEGRPTGAAFFMPSRGHGGRGGKRNITPPLHVPNGLDRPRRARCHGGAMSNPRNRNGAARRAIKARWRSLGEPCHICGKPIDYALGMVVDPDTGKRRPHPMSLAIDEIVPVSKGGDPLDFGNTRPTHWICNARRGDGTRGGKPTASLGLPQPWEL